MFLQQTLKTLQRNNRILAKKNFLIKIFFSLLGRSQVVKLDGYTLDKDYANKGMFVKIQDLITSFN